MRMLSGSVFQVEGPACENAHSPNFVRSRGKSRCLQEWVGHLEPKFQGEVVVLGEYFLVSTKLDLENNSAIQKVDTQTDFLYQYSALHI